MSDSPVSLSNPIRSPRPDEWALARAAPPATGHWDEWRHGGGSDLRAGSEPAPHWTRFFSSLGNEGPQDLDRRAQRLAQQLRDNGVTYNVYTDQHSHSRPWSLDLFPLIVTPQDWSTIEAGVLQRTRLLNRILGDLYGPRELLKRGLLPPALVDGHPGYLHALHGFRPAADTWLHIAAFDLAHGPDGRWWVVSHRTQAPSGLGYLLENRIAIGAQFPSAFSDLRVQRLAGSYKALVQGLQALNPLGRQARIALLTPGPYNETYFEHAYLARYLGLDLVEGHDLTVRDRRLYLKTLQGLEPVDVLIKRLDDEWLDPLELRPDSALGVPGLMQAVRAGHLLLANAPGSAPLESSAMLGFLPAISQAWTGESLTLPSLATWWCGEGASLAAALPLLRHSVVKPTYPDRSMDTVIGPTLDNEALDRLTGRLVRQPDAHTVQAYLPLSQQPTWHDGRIAPRPAMLRVFALCDGPQSWRVLPGGLVRLAPQGHTIASMQRGGSSADCWVLTEGEVDPTSLLRGSGGTPNLALNKRPVTSRSAENLFWLGRYTERAEHTVRLARLALRCLQGEAAGSPELLSWLSLTARHNGLILADVPDATLSPRVFERSLIAQLGADSGSHSVGFNLRRLRQSADNVRERLSQEQRVLIDRLDDGFGQQHRTWMAGGDWVPTDALSALDAAMESLSAITGLQTDRMMRDDGWRMLSIGRHIERLGALSHALAAALTTGCAFEDGGFEAVLALFDSTITFHAHYQQRRDLVALLDLLLTHRDNPRSLAWVLATLRARVSKLPAIQGSPPERLLDTLPDPDRWDLATLCLGHEEGTADNPPHTPDSPPPLLELLQTLERGAYRLSDALGHAYFSHADRLNHSVMG